jgi:hypothetical protein
LVMDVRFWGNGKWNIIFVYLITWALTLLCIISDIEKMKKLIQLCGIKFHFNENIEWHYMKIELNSIGFKFHWMNSNLHIKIGVYFVCDHKLNFLNYGALHCAFGIIKKPSAKQCARRWLFCHLLTNVAKVIEFLIED